MEQKVNKVFQIDSDIVNKYRCESANFSIEFDENSPNTDLCIIWFSSNDIYFPNNEKSFNKSIVVKDYYEWRASPPLSAKKHIFVRDLYKQWYLAGINDVINTPPQLLNFLKKETGDYRVITVGSSAGGYAACLYGSWLIAEKIYAFNPQFEINSLLLRTTEEINPLLFRNKSNTQLRALYDITPYLGQVPIFYFVSENSKWDESQLYHIRRRNIGNITTILLQTKHHGIPFPKVALPGVLSCDIDTLQKMDGKRFSPIGFSIKFAGIAKTISGTFFQLLKSLKKRIHRSKLR